MTNLSILNQFFNERIRIADGQTKPLLQRLKNVCEKRASGQISEQKALFELDKILGRNSAPLIPNFVFGSAKQKPVNLFAGVRSNYKPAPIINQMKEFNLVNKREQFPVLGLKPLNSNSKRKRFVVSPMSRTWFDAKDFKRQEPVVGGLVGKVVQNRFDENNKAMKNLFNAARQNARTQPVLQGMTTPLNPRKGQRVFSKRKQSVFEMMGGKK